MATQGSWAGIVAQPPYALAVVLAVTSLAALLSAWLFPVGFQGRDDLQYMLAAERWIADGIVVGRDHWSNRLPYILTMVAAFRIVGQGELALLLLHSLCFVATGLFVWLIARQAFQQRSVAWFALALFIATPLMLRLPSTFYPEALEFALSSAAVLIVLGRHRLPRRARPWWLLLGGLLAGLALSIRQTSIALPLAFAAVILFDGSQPFRARIADLLPLAGGYALPVLSELAFYWAATGDAFYRFSVDSRHIEIPSEHLVGQVYDSSRGILFNWDLASRWRVPSVIDSHWTVAPLVRLFTSPGMLLTPWLAAGGGILAWRMGPRPRELASLVVLLVVISYATNTFVLGLAPNTRYFGVSLALLPVLGAVALVRLPRRAVAIAAYLVFAAVPGVLVATVQPHHSATLDLVEEISARAATRLHLIGHLAKMSALRLGENRTFTSSVSHEPVPPGGLVAGLFYDRPRQWERKCDDGNPAFVEVAVFAPESIPWKAVEAAGVANMIPPRVVRVLRREADSVHIHRRRC